MECPKCGYERESEDTHCSLCGVDFDLLERQEAEKKALKQMAKNGNGLGPGEVAPNMEMEEKAPPPTGEVVGECPNCGFSRRPGENECRHCGVIFEKHEQLTEQKKAEEEAKKKEEQRRIAEKHARIQEEAKKGILEAQAKRERESAGGYDTCGCVSLWPSCWRFPRIGSGPLVHGRRNDGSNTTNGGRR